MNPVRILPIAATSGFSMFVLIYATASFSGGEKERKRRFWFYSFSLIEETSTHALETLKQKKTKTGHLNPAITVGALVANKISCMRAVAYVFMQIAGAIVGTAFVGTIDSVGPAANVLSSTGRVGHAGAFMVEFLLTFMLMFVTLSATDASRYRSVSHLPVLAPLAIGMTYFIAYLAAVPIDGASLNPARFLGTFVLSGVGGWAMVRREERSKRSFFFLLSSSRALDDDHEEKQKDSPPPLFKLKLKTKNTQWVFFVAPFAGAIGAAFVYELGFKPDYDGLIDLEGGASAAAAAPDAAVAK